MCSSFELQTFKNFILEQGALDLLKLPFTQDSLIQCLTKYGILNKQL